MMLGGRAGEGNGGASDRGGRLRGGQGDGSGDVCRILCEKITHVVPIVTRLVA